MKKLFLLALLIIGISALFVWEEGSEKNVINPEEVSEQDFHPDPSSASFTFDEGVVTLSSGKSEVEDDFGFVSETTLLPERAYGDLNDDGKEDAVVLMAQSGGGSGVFIYVAAYVSGPVSYKGTNAVFLGDRVAPESTSISGETITVKYLDRKADEPFAAEPTVPTTARFTYRNGELEKN